MIIFNDIRKCPARLAGGVVQGALMTFNYPVFLNLTGINVLVVGGGPVALRKATGLAQAGAIVTVIAPQLLDGFETVTKRIEQRSYRQGDAAKYQLVITATNDPTVNGLVAAEARANQVWVNSADDPSNCSFILPAIARRGLVTVAVSTNGASPSLARQLRTDIATAHLTATVEADALQLGRLRAERHASGAPSTQ